MTARPVCLLAIGDVAWDIVVRPDRPLVWGSDVFGAVRLLPGGSAGNVAVWARRSGARATLVGTVGDDALGDLMRRHLAAEDIDARLVTVTGGQTARVGVIVSERGERAFVTDKISLIAFTEADCQTTLLDRADVVFLSGYCVFTAGSAAFAAPLLGEARRRGIPIALDPSSSELINEFGPERLMAEIGPCDYLLVNESEAGALGAGDRPATLQRWARIVVLKRGPRGAVVYEDQHEIAASPFPADVVDTTGAGDAFDAAFLVEFTASRDVRRALARANRLGAHVASQLGAQPAAPDGWPVDVEGLKVEG